MRQQDNFHLDSLGDQGLFSFTKRVHVCLQTPYAETLSSYLGKGALPFFTGTKQQLLDQPAYSPGYFTFRMNLLLASFPI